MRKGGWLLDKYAVDCGKCCLAPALPHAIAPED